jgi:hypothetical protein
VHQHAVLPKEHPAIKDLVVEYDSKRVRQQIRTHGDLASDAVVDGLGASAVSVRAVFCAAFSPVVQL